ncbi:bifunctional 4-hydroxy-2-oxoglutarate aldolase/2-dehydro-3-deoxy-phosphogluconate aldolase [Desulfospira joergensenii]|uniref:bifunctional 4-hydroxy-2-oxoglutarate aldolase/2-dehydro-3-deoxy-phosphogluconate aldolase n=1 Tax=Desulfospira joergensenii TaxID=53329 RepID=UPI0003B337D7|nr:bifunctional 4-hydroxy-2-oxoglutarate aldolase/2-dehydro-3-deoxy-phosphogluconate aldolase [Desulfospira joergensenii]
MQDILNAIEAAGIFPVVEIDRLEDAVPVAEALRKGGIAAMEITLRTPCACDAIHAVRKAFPEMMVGAGTVLTPDQVEQARDAGAGYMVSPGYNPRIVRYCLDAGILIIPGIDSPSGIELAIEAGLSVLKFFPAQFSGGIDGLKSMAAPFKNRIRFLPLGGITPENISDYVRCGEVLAVGGTWIAKNEIIREGDFSRITQNAREAMALLHGFEFSGLELNVCGKNQDADLLDTLSRVFTLPRSGLTALRALEDGDSNLSGKIRIACNNIKRGAMWLKNQSIQADTELVELESKDETSVVLAGRPGGFRIQLIEK